MSKLYIFSFKNNYHRYFESYGQSPYVLQSNGHRMKSSHGHFSLPYLKSKIKESNYKIYNWGSTPLHKEIIDAKLCMSNISGHWITTKDSATAMYIKLSVDEFINTRSTCKYAGSYILEEDEINNTSEPFKKFKKSSAKLTDINKDIMKYNNAVSYLRSTMNVISNIEGKDDTLNFLKEEYHNFSMDTLDITKVKENLIKEVDTNKNNILSWIESKRTAV